MRLASLAPGLAALRGYRPSQDLFRDVFAGLSVAAVALPVSIAYAELAGLDPVTGLYASILPLLAYALFGTSRQLMVNPDAVPLQRTAGVLQRRPLTGSVPSRCCGSAAEAAMVRGRCHPDGSHRHSVA